MGKAIGNFRMDMHVKYKNPLLSETILGRQTSLQVRIKPQGSVLVLFLILLFLVSSGFITKGNLAGEKQYFILKSKIGHGSVYYVSHTEKQPKVKGAKLIFQSTSAEVLQQIKPSNGDHILFRSGDIFQGNLHIEAQGKQDAPIRIGSFGKRQRPVLDGNGAKAVIYLFNPAHIIIENLEIINEKGDYGILIEARNAGELKNILIQDMDIHNVFVASKQKEIATDDKYKNYGGIKSLIYKGEQPTWWNGFIVRRNYIHDLGVCGFSFGSEYPLHEKRREGMPAYPSLSVLVENNIIKNIIRDGIIMRQVDGAVMQYNEVCKTGLNAVANGIWYWDAQNSIIQRNTGHDCHSFGNDGGPFSIDYYGKNCTIQYNYSYNNDGPGMMVFGNHETGKGDVIRGNVSYNDNRIQQEEGFAAISVISKASEVIIEDNTIIAGSETFCLLDHHGWEGLPIQVTYRNNKFYGNNKARFGKSLDAAATFEGNIFTNVPNLPEHIKGEKDYRIFDKAYADSLATGLYAGVKESGFMVK